MLSITIPAVEGFNEATSEFFMYPEIPLELEHSLVSLSLWESKWEIPFLNPAIEKTTEQTLDYIRCMATSEISLDDLSRLTEGNIKAINEYIDRKYTATTFSELPEKFKGNNTIVTAEIIYYWLVALTIPFEAEGWHLNKLLALVKVVNIKNQPAKKGGQTITKDEMAERRAENARRRAEWNTKG
jgi:hypothetical protein